MQAEELATLLWPQSNIHREALRQCALRTRDTDWPTAELVETRTPTTKVARDVLNVLGKRRMIFIGGSVMWQSVEALLCAMVGAGAEGDLSTRFSYRGFFSFAEHNVRTAPGPRNGSCAGLPSTTHLTLEQLMNHPASAACVAEGTRVRDVLNDADVALVAYEPTHYAMNLGWWTQDLSILLPILEAYARQTGKLAIVREPFAQHFPGTGSFKSAATAGNATPSRACCQAMDHLTTFNNFNFHATRVLRLMVGKLAPHVHILPWYNATVRRHAAHIGTRVACYERQGESVATGAETSWRVSRGCTCDCTHFCYTPLFYDATLFTPLHAILAAHQHFC
jgi:hypothetical protein